MSQVFFSRFFKLKFVFMFFPLVIFADERNFNKIKMHQKALNSEAISERTGQEYFERGQDFEKRGDFKRAYFNYEKARDAGERRGEEAISRFEKEAEQAFLRGQLHELKGFLLSALHQFRKAEGLRHPEAEREKSRLLSVIARRSLNQPERPQDRGVFRKTLEGLEISLQAEQELTLNQKIESRQGLDLGSSKTGSDSKEKRSPARDCAGEFSSDGLDGDKS